MFFAVVETELFEVFGHWNIHIKKTILKETL